MINFTLYKRELKGSLKALLFFAAVLTLYISMIITMYDPDTINMLQFFAETMPELMSAVGMSGTPTDLTGFISSYLYGMLLLVFPMIYTILRANNLIARYVDRGSMVSLVAAPVKRSVIALSQIAVLVSGILALILFSTILEIGISAAYFPGALDIPAILAINAGLLCLHLFIGGVCFLASCYFDDSKYSIAFGAGIPTLMFILQMLANTGGNAANVKYATFFTLYNADSIIAGDSSALIGSLILFFAALLLFSASVIVFSKKDLHI